MGNIGFREGGSSPSAVGFQEGEQLNMEFAEGGGHASFHTNCPRTIPSPSALISTSQVEHLNLFYLVIFLVIFSLGWGYLSGRYNFLI